MTLQSNVVKTVQHRGASAGQRVPSIAAAAMRASKAKRKSAAREGQAPWLPISGELARAHANEPQAWMAAQALEGAFELTPVALPSLRVPVMTRRACCLFRISRSEQVQRALVIEWTTCPPVLRTAR